MNIDPTSSTELYRRAAQPVLDELAELGFKVHQLPELRRFGARYAVAVPALARHLASTQHAGVKEDLARVLAVPWAKEQALRPLLQTFRSTPNSPPATKAAIAAAIEVLADASIELELIELCLATEHGNARELLVLALAKLDSPGVVEVLTDLLRDRGVGGHALRALLARAQRGRIEFDALHIKPYFGDGRAWVRRAAKELAQVIDAQR